MKSKSPQKLRMAPLQTFEVVPITDPVEIAALERRIQAAEKAIAAREARALKAKARKKAR